MLATLRLFKALPVEGHYSDNNAFALLATRTVPSGYIVAPELASSYTHFSILNQINELYGRDGRELNNAFHKSFATVRDSSMEQLVFQQMVHYLTTYGAQHFGCYNEDSIYIPAEALDVPQFSGARLIVIRGLSKLELREELLKLLRSGIALSEQSVKDCVEIAGFIGRKAFNATDVESVKNREVKVALYDLFGMVPDSPVEFLRFIVYRATGETLLIKNAALIQKLRESDVISISKYFTLYNPAKLATIFYRYKPLFLALRRNSYMRGYINEVRRLAVKHHKPMPEDYLNTVTARIKNREGIKEGELLSALESANTFRKIRLAYALKFRTVKPDSILYRVRNGKSFAKAFSVRDSHGAIVVGEYVLQSIVNDLRANVAGKSIYIPPGLRYALPATEKQFTGHLPTGTCVEVDEDLVVGIHWNNLDGPKGGHATKQIDLDLSIANMDGKIGWDGSYRNGSVLFSGDLTSAPPPYGASEVFHIGGQGSWLMSVNYYNAGYGDSIDPVPFKILAARENRANIGNRRVIDPNKIIAFSNSVMDVKQKTVGLIVADGQSKRFYFTEAAFMSGRTARHTTAAEHARKYLVSYYENTISLNEVLALAGADLDTRPEVADIDLSPEVVDKSTIINLISGEN